MPDLLTTGANPTEPSEGQNLDGGTPGPEGVPPEGVPPEGAPPEGAEPAVIPEKYEFNLPEGATMDPELQTDFESTLRDLKLSQADANRFFDLGVKLQTKWQAVMEQRFADQIAEWKKQSETDKDFGGVKWAETQKVAQAAFADQELTPPGFASLLRQYGLVNHPEVIRHFHRLGLKIKQDTIHTGSGGEGPLPAEKVLYPSMN